MKKQGVKYWHKRLWKVYSQYIRLRDYSKQVDPDPYLAPCISCHKMYPIAGVGCMQAGHFITTIRGEIRYDERNVHAQCYNCNVNLKGAWDMYYASMLRMYGQEVIDELMSRRMIAKRFNPVELEKLYYEYKRKLGELTDQYGNPF